MDLIFLEHVLDRLGSNYGIIDGNIARIDRKKFTYKFICKWEYYLNLDLQSQETKNIIKNLI